MPNKPDNAVETTATDGRANAVTGDGASDKHASDAERAEVEALNARVAQLSEALAQCCQSGHEIAGMAESFIWSRDVKSLTNYGSNVASLANAALSGTGTDWLEAHDAQVRAQDQTTIADCRLLILNMLKKHVPEDEVRAFLDRHNMHGNPLRGSADAPEGI